METHLAGIGQTAAKDALKGCHFAFEGFYANKLVTSFHLIYSLKCERTFEYVHNCSMLQLHSTTFD